MRWVCGFVVGKVRLQSTVLLAVGRGHEERGLSGWCVATVLECVLLWSDVVGSDARFCVR